MPKSSPPPTDEPDVILHAVRMKNKPHLFWDGGSMFYPLRDDFNVPEMFQRPEDAARQLEHVQKHVYRKRFSYKTEIVRVGLKVLQ